MKNSSKFAATLMLIVAGLVLSAPAQAAYPVVLVNGYQGPSCSASTTQPPSANDFGNLESLLGQQGIPAVFFDNCQVCPQCSLEDLGNSFAKFMANLKYSNGAAIPRVDVVAVSMGGLIVRAYMSGIQANSFAPPVDTKIRKAIFIGTPHFGTDLLNSLSSLYTQTAEMRTGSAFLSRLATWNQDREDLRGVDALAIAGSGGQNQYDDGVVALSSASLDFAAADERTRIIPYCHTDPSNFMGIFSCQSGAKFLDRVDNANHLGYQIVLSFLTGTSAWRTIGQSPSQNPYLSRNGGAFISLRSAADQAIALTSVTATGADGKSYTLSSDVPQTFASLWLPAQNYAFNFAWSGGSVQVNTAVAAGGVRPISLKYGPVVSGVVGAAWLPERSAAPGQAISITGANLAGSQVLVNGKAITVKSAAADRIQAVLPTGILGLVALRVQNSEGSQTVNLMIEPSVPAFYSADGTGAGAVYALAIPGNAKIDSNNAAQAGETILIYATGLGETAASNGFDYARAQVTVTIGGVAAKVLYAGRVPGYPGLDEIEIQVPAGVKAGSATMFVSAGNRVSNALTLAVR